MLQTISYCQKDSTTSGRRNQNVSGIPVKNSAMTMVLVLNYFLQISYKYNIIIMMDIIYRRTSFQVSFFVVQIQGKGLRCMTPRQQKFCDAYIASGNATQSAIQAGYSKKTAYSIGEENLKKPELKKYIDEKLQAISSAKIADATEVLEYLSSVLRGESQSEVVVIEGCGDGVSEAKTMMKSPDEKERLKAGELLGRRYRLFTDRVDMNVETPKFGGEDDLEE